MRLGKTNNQQGGDTCSLHPVSSQVPICYQTFGLSILSIYFKQFFQITCKDPLCLPRRTMHSPQRNPLCYTAARKIRRNFEMHLHNIFLSLHALPLQKAPHKALDAGSILPATWVEKQVSHLTLLLVRAISRTELLKERILKMTDLQHC